MNRQAYIGESPSHRIDDDGGGICESAVKIEDNAREWVHILQEYVNLQSDLMYELY